MKIFISWSGTTSHSIAKILRDWLPSVIQSIEPYVSSEDIDKGARWSSDIAGELDTSNYGIICLTPDNLSAPWINFEAGALGKSVDKSRVGPVLFNLKKSELKGPLVQFQATVFEHDDVLKLMQSINSSLGDDALDEARLAKAFTTWWPDLEGQLNGIADTPTEPKEQTQLDPARINSVLEELIDLTRANHKLLREPGAMMHPMHWEELIRGRGLEFIIPEIEDITLEISHIQKALIIRNDALVGEPDVSTDVISRLDRVEKNLRHIHKRVRNRIRPY
ncbi:MAG: toll/interleukin-1 receptor domain-containing protein [Gammaproteobacteria bacterium]|nr:toll/interleukin-1 receptor domain-containing protein [Gammaproteobacteria bacterium]MBU1490600.1 toll/interleukin-1 receptor domain-containing protein [Gammaproteobacteria bacterium]MBU2137441.1 toll/interleukin-1 receptor domain-containing protein [Gammaproteobacteria bacterium]MBU2218360.1 toll/interleukin-1 receptor domain-containing protein [Gammaproteobacteria bacterium]MBU2321895.1 toll/interleukin-1 receptor domain-containing protein [Gammaproteobacteria bacterium]